MKDAQNPPEEQETTEDLPALSLRHEGRHDVLYQGMQFQWWIEGDDPYLVVVSNSLLGTAAAPCLASPERTAMRLAEHLFGKSDALFDIDTEAGIPEDETSSLDKTGWFEKSRR